MLGVKVFCKRERRDKSLHEREVTTETRNQTGPSSAGGGGWGHGPAPPPKPPCAAPSSQPACALGVPKHPLPEQWGKDVGYPQEGWVWGPPHTHTPRGTHLFDASQGEVSGADGGQTAGGERWGGGAPAKQPPCPGEPRPQAARRAGVPRAPLRHPQPGPGGVVVSTLNRGLSPRPLHPKQDPPVAPSPGCSTPHPQDDHPPPHPGCSPQPRPTPPTSPPGCSTPRTHYPPPPGCSPPPRTHSHPPQGAHPPQTHSHPPPRGVRTPHLGPSVPPTPGCPPRTHS